MEIETRDCDAAAEFANSIAAHRARIGFDDPAAVHFRLRTADWGELSADHVRALGVRYRTDGDPLDYLLAGVILGGAVKLRSGDREARLSAGDSFAYPVDAPYTADCRDPELMDVRVPLPAIRELAEQTAGQFAFHELTPVSAVLGGYWATVVVSVYRQLTVPELAPPPLLADQLRRFVAAAALTVFPNTTMTAGRTAAAGWVEPAVVRRARDFIDANAESPLRIGQIADACGVSARAVQTAFRRHLDTTPTAYLRSVRLRHVRRDLRAAIPGETVALIAHRWGFGNLGRFAGEYRDAFGELPSRTLRG